MAFLWNTEICGIEDSVSLLIWEPVTSLFKLRDQILKDAGMTPSRHPRHVLHNEKAWAKRRNETEKMKYELVAAVVHQALANRRKTLTGWPTRNEVDFAIPRVEIAAVPINPLANSTPQRLRFEWGGHVSAQDLRGGEIELVRRRMHWVVLDGSDDIESSLLKTKREPSGSSKKVDGDGPSRGQSASSFSIMVGQDRSQTRLLLGRRRTRPFR